MRRALSCLAAVAASSLVACGGASSAEASAAPGAASNALTIPPSGVMFMLTAFDTGTGTFTGVNNQQNGFTAAYASTTKFRLADLSNWAPTEPCRDVAAAYNAAISVPVNDTVGFNETILNRFITAALPQEPCKARVLLDTTGLMASFQPVP